ncbi:hypothetical protein T492DRAFT_911860 [Pavlovales sp. CCMP2436]|nr:hypothetical protein T492DRAFT_911860 [Pavlovales sp. CCMP2436]
MVKRGLTCDEPAKRYPSSSCLLIKNMTAYVGSSVAASVAGAIPGGGGTLVLADCQISSASYRLIRSMLLSFVTCMGDARGTTVRRDGITRLEVDCTARYSGDQRGSAEEEGRGLGPRACCALSATFDVVESEANTGYAHTGQQPYACKLCAKRFSEKSNCESMSRRRALDGGKKGGSKNFKAAAARQAREDAGVRKYAPPELEAEDVSVPHVVDLVLDVVVVDEALVAKRALSAASSKQSYGAKKAREATAGRATHAACTAAPKCAQLQML